MPRIVLNQSGLLPSKLQNVWLRKTLPGHTSTGCVEHIYRTFQISIEHAEEMESLAQHSTHFSALAASIWTLELMTSPVQVAPERMHDTGMDTSQSWTIQRKRIIAFFIRFSHSSSLISRTPTYLATSPARFHLISMGCRNYRESMKCIMRWELLQRPRCSTL